MAKNENVTEVSEGMDLTVSHTMGYDSYQREKIFESLSLKGAVHLDNNIELVMAYKEMMQIYLQLSTYQRLMENLQLEEKPGIVKSDGTRTKTVEESNEFGFENRKLGLRVSLTRIDNKLEELEDKLESPSDKELLSKADDLWEIILNTFYSED